MKSRRDRVTFIVCLILHAAILWNVYRADQHTPRIIEYCEAP